MEGGYTIVSLYLTAILYNFQTILAKKSVSIINTFEIYLKS